MSTETLSAPYKGLRYYTAEDARIFPPREIDAENCARILGAATTKLMLLHGRSGSGKSSLLRAGLGFCIEMGRPQAQRRFHILGVHVGEDVGESAGALIRGPKVIRCSADPMIRMVEALLWALDHDERCSRLPAELRTGLVQRLNDANERATRANALLPQLLTDTLASLALCMHETLVLMIDQGEEVLTFSAGPGEREAEAGATELALLADRRALFFEWLESICLLRFDLKIVIALRTEYFGQFCDHFRLQPDLSVSAQPKTGMQQYMLSGILSEVELRRMVVYPSSNPATGDLPAGQGICDFTIAPELVTTIARSVLSNASENSPLPILQLVCKELFERVVLGSGRREILASDYDGGTERIVESYIDSALARIREICAPPHWTDHLRRQFVIADSIQERWRRILVSLVQRQAGGTFVTRIVAIQELERLAHQEGIGDDFRAALTTLAESSRPLLKGLAYSSDETGMQEFALAHDVLAAPLAKWSDLDLARRELRARRIKVRIAAALATPLVLALGLFAVVQSVHEADRRYRHATTLLNFASHSAVTPVAVRVSALVKGLELCKGWCARLHPMQASREQLAHILAALPEFDTTWSAVGVDHDGNRLVYLQDARTLRIGSTREAASGGLPVAGDPPMGAGGQAFSGELTFVEGKPLVLGASGEQLVAATVQDNQIRKFTVSAIPTAEGAGEGGCGRAMLSTAYASSANGMVSIQRASLDPASGVITNFEVSRLQPEMRPDGSIDFVSQGCRSYPLSSSDTSTLAILPIVDQSRVLVREQKLGLAGFDKAVVKHVDEQGKTSTEHEVPLLGADCQSGAETFELIKREGRPLPAAGMDYSAQVLGVKWRHWIRLITLDPEVEEMECHTIPSVLDPPEPQNFGKPFRALGLALTGASRQFAWRGKGSVAVEYFSTTHSQTGSHDAESLLLLTPFQSELAPRKLSFSRDGRKLFAEEDSVRPNGNSDQATSQRSYIRLIEWSLDTQEKQQDMLLLDSDALIRLACSKVIRNRALLEGTRSDEFELLGLALGGIRGEELCGDSR